MDPRVKYLTALTDISGYPGANSLITSVMTETSFTSVIGVSTNISGGTLLKDMGKTVTVVDETTRLHLSIWRLVQIVNGSTTEGNSGSAGLFYIRVWSADGTDTNVARTG